MFLLMFLVMDDPPLGSLVIWCSYEQDSSVTVAFDDIPEEGLNSPLRLEKVANEVCFSFFLISYKFWYWVVAYFR